MIKMFSDHKGNTKRKRKSRKKGLTEEEKAALARDKLTSLDPMVIPLLAVKIKQQPNNDFLSSSISAITERPHAMSDKWIASLNKWAKSLGEAIMLDEPDIEAGKRMLFQDMIIAKICKPNMASEYPMPAIICVDGRGWKWYFKTGKANNFSVGDKITFTATVSAHKEGITFLRRPSKIVKAAKATKELQVFMESKSD